MRLTQKTVDSLKAAKGGRVNWDDAVPGFGVAVKKGKEPVYCNSVPDRGASTRYRTRLDEQT